MFNLIVSTMELDQGPLWAEGPQNNDLSVISKSVLGIT
jgi:hypothetical protein